ncbi:MAG: phenylalanine--tRNA ligase subunit alpha, partial [Oscillospiraceae bacterium]
MNEKIAAIMAEFEQEIREISDSGAIEKIRVGYLGKKGAVTELLKGLKDVAADQKKELGQSINVLKKQLEERITEQIVKMQKAEEETLVSSAERYDVTLPVTSVFGSYHPITLVQR